MLRKELAHRLSSRPKRLADLCHRLACHRQAIAVQQAAIEQALHQGLDATDCDQFRHRIFPARSQIGEHRNTLTDSREVVECQLHLRRTRDGEHVQHRIRRTTQRDRDGDGVLERLASHDLSRRDARLK